MFARPRPGARLALPAIFAAALVACSFSEPDWTGKRCGGADGVCPQGWSCDPVSSTCATGLGGAGAGATGGGGAGLAGGGGGGPCVPEPEDCATPADDDCDGTANDHCALWHYQHKAPQFLQLPFDVAIEPLRGNIVVGGQATSDGKDNAMIVGLAPGGVGVPWVLDLGDGEPQEVQGVGFDADGNVLVAGIFRGTMVIGADTLTSAGQNDIFAAKLSPRGEPLWAVGLGGAVNEEAHSMTALPDGGMVLAGSTLGDGPLGQAPGAGRDALVLRLDPNGAVLWSRVFGGSGSDSANEARVAADGSVVVVGDIAATVDFGGGPHVAAGQDVFVASWSADGTFLWARSFGGPMDQVATCVALDGDGDVYVTGTFEGPFDILGQAQVEPTGIRDLFAVRLSADGATHLWSRGFGGRGAIQRPESVGVIGDRVYLAGALEGAVDFGGGALVVVDAPDVYVAALEAATGAHVWSRRFGLSGNQGYRGVAMDTRPNGLVVTGDFGDGSVDFGVGVLTAADPGDTFIVELQP